MFTELPTHLRAAPICKNSFQINKEKTPSWWHWNCFQTFDFVSVSSEEFVELIFAFKSVYMPSLLASINAVISRLFRRFSKGNTTFSFDVWTTFFVLSLCNASEKIPGGFRISWTLGTLVLHRCHWWRCHDNSYCLSSKHGAKGKTSLLSATWKENHKTLIR